jgi:hypothetical protein
MLLHDHALVNTGDGNSSLRDLFTRSYTPTSLPVSTWHGWANALHADAAWYPDCNKQGFNVAGPNVSCRFGLLSTTPEVSLRIAEPDYDSGWFAMASQSANASYVEVLHGLGAEPGYVQVQVQAVDGANQNYIFNGAGSQQNDDDYQLKTYGGVVFGYNDNFVRLWAPTTNNGQASGKIVLVEDGWGNEINAQASDNALV